ncbi:ZBED8-like 1, partial [Homarus americanus]
SNLVAAGFEISKIIALHGKPLGDGEYIKESWLECSHFLFNGFPEKEKIIQHIKDLPVSRNTVKDRILKMETNIVEHLTKDIGSCKLLSIRLDESTDVISSARLAIIARFCRGDETCEELVNLVTLHELTTGAEICKAVKVSVTIDGAPSMIGREAGFVNLFEKYVGHPLVAFHCNVHQEALCAKADLKELEKSLFSVMNFVNSNYRSRLTDETSAACIALKTTKYKPDIKYLSSLVQQQKSH